MGYEKETIDFIKNQQEKIDLLVKNTLNNHNNIRNIEPKNNEFDNIDELNEISQKYLGKKIFRKVK